MPATEIEDRLQQWRVRAGATTAVVVAGGQIGQGLITGLGRDGASRQVSDRAQRQIELPGDLGWGGPEAGHLGDGQP
jgi:hypothetical protein